jgi:hypothetical protein
MGNVYARESEYIIRNAMQTEGSDKLPCLYLRMMCDVKDCQILMSGKGVGDGLLYGIAMDRPHIFVSGEVSV